MTAATAHLIPLSGYTRPASIRARRVAWTTLVFLAVFSGFVWTLFGPGSLTVLAPPLALVVLVAIWLLPDTGRVPARLLTSLAWAFLAALLIWPDYLALALPGLPWITAIRLVGVPLALVFLLCLSQSSGFRRDLARTLNTNRLLWALYAGFTVLGLLSIAVSADPVLSLNRFVVAQLNWTAIFLVAAALFGAPGRATRLAYVLWAIAIAVSAIGLWEWRLQRLPWVGHIPSFLAVGDEAVQRILAGTARAATGIYRVQSKFTTSLGLAEYLSYALPFVMHLTLTARRLAVRVAAGASVPVFVFVIALTDARLGMVGFFSSLLLTAFAWSARRWRRDRGSLFGPAVTLSYPVVIVSFIAATFFVGRLRALIWGTGAQQFSTDARQEQVASGLARLAEQPWGYGFGRAAEVVGYRNLDGLLSIDTYWLAIAIDVGVLGFILYYGAFLAGIWRGARAALVARDSDTAMLVPITIALVNFVVIKSIFSQVENHPLAFLLLGASVALAARVDQGAGGNSSAAAGSSGTALSGGNATSAPP